MKELVLSEKYRPKTIEDIILLPRVRKIFEHGINESILLHGHCGTGKTSLINILIGVYTKDKPILILNGSKDTSIDILRTKIDAFCSTVYMGLDMKVDIKADSTKYVFIDECDRISVQYQDALKAYMEDKRNKNVVFILNTNHLNKLTKELKSRLLLVNFDCQDKTEETFLKTLFYKRVQSVITVKEKFEISKEDLAKIINKNFPDFRQTLISLDHFRKCGEITNGSSIDFKLKEDLFNKVLNGKDTFNEIYHYIMETFGDEKVDEMISILGRPFIDYICEKYPELSEKLFNVSYIITEHTKLLETSTDPVILGITVLSKIREIFK